MNNTGERHFIKENFNNEAAYYGHLMHLATYNFSLDFVKNKNILDFGCGSGYGSKIMSKKALSVIGVDISNNAIEYAKKNYSAENLTFLNINQINSLEFQKKFDVVTSFQVIEHVSNEKKYIETILRLLKPNGVFLVSTPNKDIRLYKHIQKPWNIFHVKEYNEGELTKLMKQYFINVEMLNISAKSEFVFHEIFRVSAQKKITLPITLFFIPRFLTIQLLKFQKNIYAFLKPIKNKIQNNKNIKTNNSIFKSSYCIDDILIGKNLENFTDLLCICRNKKIQ